MRRVQRNKVADVAIVAVVGRRISVFLITLLLARAWLSSLCDLALHEMPAIVIIQPILLLGSTAVKA
jgi:hypothetical protein